MTLRDRVQELRRVRAGKTMRGAGRGLGFPNMDARERDRVRREYVKAFAQREGEAVLPAMCCPVGWLERAQALRVGEAKPRDWEAQVGETV